MVDIFCWNVRGFNDPIKHRCLRKWIRLNKAHFGTRVQQHKSIRLLNSSFPNWNFVTNYEHADLGRIWVVWDKSITLSVIFKSNQLIRCVVKMANLEAEVLVNFVYAVNCKYGRRELWSDLTEVLKDPRVVNKPCLTLGEFNQALNPADSEK